MNKFGNSRGNLDRFGNPIDFNASRDVSFIQLIGYLPNTLINQLKLEGASFTKKGFVIDAKSLTSWGSDNKLFTWESIRPAKILKGDVIFQNALYAIYDLNLLDVDAKFGLIAFSLQCHSTTEGVFVQTLDEKFKFAISINKTEMKINTDFHDKSKEKIISHAFDKWSIVTIQYEIEYGVINANVTIDNGVKHFFKITQPASCQPGASLGGISNESANSYNGAVCNILLYSNKYKKLPSRFIHILNQSLKHGD